MYDIGGHELEFTHQVLDASPIEERPGSSEATMIGVCILNSSNWQRFVLEAACKFVHLRMIGHDRIDVVSQLNQPRSE